MAGIKIKTFFLATLLFLFAGTHAQIFISKGKN